MAKPTRLTLHLGLFFIVLQFAGCSELPYVLGLEPTGARWDGSYSPFPAEKAYDCRELRVHIGAHESLLIGMDQRAAAEAGAASATLLTGVRRMFGGVSGLKAVHDFENGVVKLEALEELSLLAEPSGLPPARVIDRIAA